MHYYHNEAPWLTPHSRAIVSDKASCKEQEQLLLQRLWQTLQRK